MSTQASLSDYEKEILQEIINIAFGSASAALAEIVDIYVVLNVPEIQVMAGSSMPEFIKNLSIPPSYAISLVNQKFWGDFNGSGILVFPNGAEKQLISFFDDASNGEEGDSPIDMLEGVLTEVGNILIGACVGKVAELFKTFVTYSPPTVLTGDQEVYLNLINSFDKNQFAISMKTVFTFKEKDVSGFLLLLTNQESFDWLKKSVHEFMESFQ